MTALVADLAGLLGCVVRGAQTWENGGGFFFSEQKLEKTRILKAKKLQVFRKIFNKIFPFLKIIVTGYYSFWSYEEASLEVLEWVIPDVQTFAEEFGFSR